jgi:hypothetical protein
LVRVREGSGWGAGCGGAGAAATAQDRPRDCWEHRRFGNGLSGLFEPIRTHSGSQLKPFPRLARRQGSSNLIAIAIANGNAIANLTGIACLSGIAAVNGALRRGDGLWTGSILIFFYLKWQLPNQAAIAS